MNTAAKVSIGMPVYNGEKYISEAIESILSQTYTDFELVISDNASVDDTQAICRAYAAKDARIRYFRNTSNLGAAPNYNRTYQLSSGIYFKWADYDDLLASDFLDKCVAVLDNLPDVVLVYPQSRIIDEHGAVLGDYEYKANATSEDPKIRFRNIVLRPDTAYQVSGLIRSSVVKRTRLHGSFPASDLVFLAELAFYGRFYEIEEKLFFPRYHPNQSTKGALAIERDRTVFFDAANAGKILLPKWQYLLAYLRAISASPLDNRTKIYCYAQMLRWASIPDHFRALGKDLLLAGQKILVRSVTRRNLARRQTPA